MATTSQEEIDKLNDELDKIDRSIRGIANTLDTRMSIALQRNLSGVRDLSAEFEKGKNITNKVEEAIRKTGRALEANALKAIRAKKQELEAQRAGDVIAEKIAQKKLNELSVERQILQQIDYQYRELQKINEEYQKRAGWEKILNALGLANLFTFKAILDVTFKIDNQITQMGKSLGVSKALAKELRDSMASYSMASKDAFVTVERLVKAQEGLTEQLGIAVDFGNEERETFARLTEITGLAADEAGKLAKFSAATGTTTKKYVSDLRVAGMEAAHANKIHISDKELLSSIAKLSAGILVKFQGNPKALAAAVVEAKKLGLSLEQVDKIGDSLLNWQSSIENELEAELITNRKLNFEAARYAALTGDQATLMQEVAKQAGSLADYQNMNVIAQESLAKAFGMSRDEMSEMLIKQEAINKYGDKASELNAEQLKDMEKRNMTAEQYLAMVENQRSVQDKFNDAMIKLQEIIGNIVAGPLGKFLDVIASILGNTIALSAVLGGVMVINLMKMLNVLKQAKKISYGQAIVSIVKSAYESLGGLPGIGMVLAGAAAAAGIAYLATSSKQEVEDGIAPAGKGPFTITDKFGATAVTAAGDGLAVSPNINVNKGGGNGGGGGDNTMAQTIGDKLDKHFQAIANFVQKPAYIDGKDAFANDLGKSRALGTSQNINTAYRVA